MIHYLVTLAKHQVLDYVDYDYLTNIINTLNKPFFNIIDYCLEYHGTYKQLHAHMIVQVNKCFRYKVYVKAVEGFIMHFKLIKPPIKHVKEYIHKHCEGHSPERLQQIKYINYYKSHYGF